MRVDSGDVLGQLLIRRADEDSSLPFLFSAEGTYSYGQLFEEASHLARGLFARGVSTGDHVVVWLPNCVQWVVVEMASALLGATLIPLNVRLRPREFHYMLTESDPRFLIMMPEFMSQNFVEVSRGAFPAFWNEETSFASLGLPKLQGIINIGPGVLPRGENWEDVVRSGKSQSQDPTAQLDRQKPEDPMLVVWTSGTTSAPKAALLSHEGLPAIAQWFNILGYTVEDRTVVSMPLYYIAAHYYGLLGGLLAGGSVILGQRLDTTETLGSISRFGGTMLLGGPSSYLSLLAHPDRESHDLSSVRRGYVGGAVVTPQQVRAIREELGVSGLVQVYGMTETHGVVTSTLPGESDEELALTVGRPLDGVEITVVDTDTRERLGTDQPGEMLIRGRTMSSYLNLTTEEQASSWDGDWFRSGDLMSIDGEGRAKIRGRIKDIIKCGGENVAAAEVEDVIRSSALVEEAAVVGIPDEKRGEVVAAAVEFRSDVQGSPSEELLAWLKGQLAPFKVPRQIYVIDAPADWPRNVSHKIVKNMVRDRILALQEHP